MVICCRLIFQRVESCKQKALLLFFLKKIFYDCIILLQIFSMQTYYAVKPQARHRIESIDILRGTIMVIMALDHVRDFFHHDGLIGNDPLDLKTTWPVLFFTRWITHFCAPVFVFLSGTSVFLYSQKGKTKNQVAFFLFTRGLWLMLAEIFIVNVLWQFDFGSRIWLWVIWCIGLCMVVLSVLQFLPFRVLLILGLAIVFGHNLLDGIKIEQPFLASVGWSILHVFHFYSPKPGLTLMVAYPFLPWLGLMILGYCLGTWYSKNVSSATRKKFLLVAGLSSMCLFMVLRLLDFYGDMNHWVSQKTVLLTLFDFLDTTKYPPSLLYMLMTIGPALIILALTENVSNRFTEFVRVFGKVPFFYYLIHVFFIHCLALLFAEISGRGTGAVDLIGLQPNGGYPLWVVYVIWASVIILLYFPCKWYSKYKGAHAEKKWLSYL
jgi:uncharacterized membrane protein